MSVSVKLQGDTRALLNKMTSMSNLDLKGTMQSIGEGLRTSTQERFRSERSPGGQKWDASIRAKEDGGKTLTNTAVLKNSIKVQSSGTGIAVGTNDIRAATHQFGEDGRTIRAKSGKYLKFNINGKWINVTSVKIHIPKREFLGVSKEDEADIKTTLFSTVFER